MIEYKKALCEVEEIINHLEESEKNKISKKFIKFINENKDHSYNFKLQEKTFLIDQDLLNTTKELLAMIYIKYLADDEEKIELNNILIENNIKHEQMINEKYSMEALFKTNTVEIVKDNIVLPTQIKKLNLFQKIIKNITKKI